LAAPGTRAVVPRRVRLRSRIARLS
jgi:hypothetical protein